MRKGKIKLVFGVLTLLVMSVFDVMLNVSLVYSASETIYIRADGSVYPSGAPISTLDNVTYTLTGNITSDVDGIVIERDNITLDGAGHILQGTEALYSKGINLTGRSNVAIKNMTIKSFAYGIWLNMSSSNSLHGNYVTNSSSNAVYLYESWNNSITGNNITYSGMGINLYNSWNNSIAGNNIASNGYAIYLLESSNNNIFGNDLAENGLVGIYLDYWCSNNSLVGNNIANSWDGIYLLGSSNNSIFDNHITASNEWGVLLEGSGNCSIARNNVTNNVHGICLWFSPNSSMVGNNVTENNVYGAFLGYSGNSSLSENVISSSQYNFGVVGDALNDFMHSIDVSNLVNGKPIYYLVNKTGLSISPVTHPQVGYLALVNCSDITVESLTLSDNLQGILLTYTNNSRITNNNILTNNYYGIQLYHSLNINITGNQITNNVYGACVQYSSNSNINGNNIANNDYNGISFEYSSNNNVVGNTVTANIERGIGLFNSSSNSISENNITGNGWDGISLYNSWNCSIIRNNVTNNGWGIFIEYSSNSNYIIENNVTNSQYGISIRYSSNNSLSGNVISDCQYNFGVWGEALSEFIHSIDVSNLVNGEPIYYLVNKTGLSLNPATHPQVGYLALINCTHITVEDTTLTDNEQGLLLAYTNNSKIGNSNIIANNYEGIKLYNSWNNNVVGDIVTDNTYGIYFSYSSNNRIIGSSVANNWEGVYLEYSSNNSIVQNSVTNNQDGVILSSSSSNSISGNQVTANTMYGVYLVYSLNNRIVGNNITTNTYYGIFLHDCSNNSIHHNNFVNNTEQVYIGGDSVNVWDAGYPSGGNYWSNYAGNDSYCGPYQNELGSDGIGDTPYTINLNNTDRYPLTGPFNMFDAGTWNGIAYGVDVVSNSTVSSFYFNPTPAQPYISFNVTGESGTVGFCRVAIPKDLLWAEDGWTVLVEGEPAEYTMASDENFTYIYFTYQHSTKTILIQGTHVIPEFPSFAILPLLMILIIFAVALVKRRLPRKP